MLGDQAPEAQKESLREQMNLNQPLGMQLKSYVTGLFTGDLGRSLSYQKPVLDLVSQHLPWTLQLACISILFTILLGIGLGVISALWFRQRFLNFFFLSISVVGQSTPNFLLGPVLILLLAIYLPILPVSGTGTVAHILLPALTLSLSLFAIVSRMTYVGLMNEARKEYFMVVRSKGVSKIKAYLTHALQNVSIPLANLIGLQLGALLTGAVVTETIFDWPGIGSLFFSAIEKRDYPLIQGLILLFTTSFAMINFGVDLLHGVLDPRLRHKTL